MLLLVAAFGMLVPNGIFLWWLAHDFSSLSEVAHDRLALALVIDACMATVVLAWLFATRPLGPVRWPWFVLLSVLGGLGFSIPFYVWLNSRRAK